MDLSTVIEFVNPKEKGEHYRLERCPFFGCREVFYAKYRHSCGADRWAVICMRCMASIDPGYAQNPFQVQLMWNTRHKEEEQHEEVFRSDYLN